jgi:hypothetical protein
MTTKEKRKPALSLPNPAGKHGASVSLYPLSFKEAVAGLARVKMLQSDKNSAAKKPTKRTN